MSSKGIYFQPGGQLCSVKGAESVLEVALNHGIDLSHSCGGMGSCTTCRIFIERSPEAIPLRNELEQEIADSRGFLENERLACQLPPIEGLTVRIPDKREEDSVK